MFTRRDFLKWTSSSVALLGLSELQILKLNQALAAGTAPPLIWLHGASCTGCSISTLNAVRPATIDDVLVNHVSVKYDSVIMAGGSDVALRALDAAGQAGGFILVVEGGIPTAKHGSYCTVGEKNGKEITLLELVQKLGPKATRAIAIGTCASFRGVPGSSPNPAGIASLSEVLAGKVAAPVINVPGCPAPPEQFLGAVVAILTGQEINLDSAGRPKALFPHPVHFICPRKRLDRATDCAQAGCMFDLGCKGPETVGLCAYHQYNDKTNWCIGAAHPCIGCSSPEFPAPRLLTTGKYV